MAQDILTSERAQDSLLAAIVILTREIFVSGLREFLAELRVSVPVTKLAKWKTTMQMVALGFINSGIQFDQDIPRFYRLSVANMDGPDHPDFEGLNDLGAF